MGFIQTRHEHLHRRFIDTDDGMCEYDIAQRINQWLQLHTAGPHPLRQRRAWDRQAGTAKNRLLAVKGQMIGKLGDHDMSQQPRGREAFVDDLCWYRCLDQGFAVIADPLATQ